MMTDSGAQSLQRSNSGVYGTKSQKMASSGGGAFWPGGSLNGTSAVSTTGPEGGLSGDTTLQPASGGFLGASSSATSGATGDLAEIRDTVARLESMQAQQFSLQQPDPKLDALIVRTLTNRPEWRQRMAVMTKSALLRKKILSTAIVGGRGIGSSTLGSTYHWRKAKLDDSFSDHNWPKAIVSEYGMHHLPGGTAKHDQVLRCPSDKLRKHPTLESTAFYSFSTDKRFPGTHHNGELNKGAIQKLGTPGPGAYFKSVPCGTHFNVDGGETVVLGANHVCPWKKSMGRQINPIDVDATTLTSAPCFSFGKSRRTASDTHVGHGLQDGGPMKSDRGALSPGPIYEHFSSMQPLPGRTIGMRRKNRSTPNLTGRGGRVRCVPMPGVDPDGDSNPADEYGQEEE
jgi:hypothetical protein